MKTRHVHTLIAWRKLKSGKVRGFCSRCQAWMDYMWDGERYRTYGDFDKKVKLTEL